MCGYILTLSQREAAHCGSGVQAMGQEAAVDGSPINPRQFFYFILNIIA